LYRRCRVWTPPHCAVLGIQLSEYLLEKSRVIEQAKGAYVPDFFSLVVMNSVSLIIIFDIISIFLFELILLGERNFHILYYLFAMPDRERYYLGEMSSYEYVLS
jgi:hypothetical protein